MTEGQGDTGLTGAAQGAANAGVDTAQNVANTLVDTAQQFANEVVDLGEDAAGTVLQAALTANRLVGDALESIASKLTGTKSG